MHAIKIISETQGSKITLLTSPAVRVWVVTEWLLDNFTNYCTESMKVRFKERWTQQVSNFIDICITPFTFKHYAFVCRLWSCHPNKFWIVWWWKTLIYLYVRQRSLTHWGRVTHVCVGKLTIIGSDNGLSPGRRQAIIWTNDGILLIGPLGTNFSEILIGIQTFSFKKMHLKMSSAKWRRFVSASMS